MSFKEYLFVFLIVCGLTTQVLSKARIKVDTSELGVDNSKDLEVSETKNHCCKSAPCRHCIRPKKEPKPKKIETFVQSKFTTDSLKFWDPFRLFAARSEPLEIAPWFIPQDCDKNIFFAPIQFPYISSAGIKGHISIPGLPASAFKFHTYTKHNSAGMEGYISILGLPASEFKFHTRTKHPNKVTKY